jgi:hypothetical protein
VTKIPYNHLKFLRPSATIKDHHIGQLYNNPKDELCRKDVVVEAQILIVQSSIPHCAIWWGREKGNVYRDSYATTKTYKVVS